MERDRSCFHALEAINGDGHKWDVWVRWPDGSVHRPMMVGFQDLYSNKMLSWRFDKTENRELIRLALGDIVETFGIPDHVYFDNTRAFANKWLTGGAKHRYRWRLRDEDPIGICEQIGMEVHFTLPYAGQSKPVERAWRDMASDVAKAPAFAGAYTGNSPVTKPYNYGEAAVDLEVFELVVGQEIAEWNARQGRRTRVAAGRSFDEVFAESYEAASTLIRVAGPEQKRLWLLAAEGVTASRENGEVKLLGNRFWAEFLVEHRGQKLIIRFDPQNVLAGLHVYSLAGAYLGFADVWEAAGFADANAAREHARARNTYLKAAKVQAQMERTMSIIERAAQIPDPEPTAPAQPQKVVRAAFGNLAIKARPEEEPQDDPYNKAQVFDFETLRRGVAAVVESRE